ncbi:hypothetical protein Barb6XT_01441 [Bacteroidales bacterium Barb6XT]|nr:hypothetical protein Barb6XT_01441 [Bacteroidales bacterium Barb6XT]
MKGNAVLSAALSAVLFVFTACSSRDNPVDRYTDNTDESLAIRERQARAVMAEGRAITERQKEARALSDKFEDRFRDNTIPEKEYPMNVIYPDYYGGDWPIRKTGNG